MWGATENDSNTQSIALYFFLHVTWSRSNHPKKQIQWFFPTIFSTSGKDIFHIKWAKVRCFRWGERKGFCAPVQALLVRLIFHGTLLSHARQAHNLNGGQVHTCEPQLWNAKICGKDKAGLGLLVWAHQKSIRRIYDYLWASAASHKLLLICPTVETLMFDCRLSSKMPPVVVLDNFTSCKSPNQIRECTCAKTEIHSF